MHVVTALDFGGVERHMEVIAATRGAASLRHVFVALGAGGAEFPQPVKRAMSLASRLMTETTYRV